MPLSIVILAAGQGKRMKSDLPKVLQPLAGQPLLVARPRHRQGRCSRPAIHVVYGHGGDQVREVLAGEPVNWVLQAEQLGTATRSRRRCRRFPTIITCSILYGDVPLVRQRYARARCSKAAA